MKAFSFIHTADLHLDSPFKGISEINEKISLELTEASFKTFNKIIGGTALRAVPFFIVSETGYNDQRDIV